MKPEFKPQFRSTHHLLRFHIYLFRLPETRLLLWVLILGLLALISVQLLTQRLNRALVLEATQWVGADIAIASTQPIPQSWLTKASQSGLTNSVTAEFPSVVFTDDQMKLAAIKAVQETYPLKGELKTSVTALAPSTEWTSHQKGPEVGETWVDQQILASLKIQLGESLSLGQKRLRVSKILQYEPDRNTNFLSLSPRVMMHWDDLTQAKVIQPGSRVTYRLLVGSPSQAQQPLEHYLKWIEQQLRPGDKIQSIADQRPTFSRASERLTLFLSISLWLTLGLALIGAALALQHLNHQVFPTFETLYYLGISPTQLKLWFAMSITIQGTFALAIGTALGIFAQEQLANSFQIKLPPVWQSLSLKHLLSWVSLGIFIPLSIGMINFTTQLQNLFDQLARKKPPASKLSVLVKNPFSWILTLSCCLLLMLTVSSWLLAGLILCLLLFATALLYGGYQLMLKLPNAFATWYDKAPTLSLRYPLINLSRLPHLYFFQVMAFVITIISGALAWSMGNELLSQWQNELPVGTPNTFSINLLPQERKAFEAALIEAGVPPSDHYPIVRGRLTAINDTPLQQATTKETDRRSQDNALRRDLNFTWRSTAPQKNEIVAGRWWSPSLENKPSLADLPEVSVEEQLAKRLDIALDDTITVTIGTQTLTATVTSIRAVKWESFEPNFYFIFQPSALQTFNHTYMSSFYIAPNQTQLLPTLAKQFSTVTFFDVKALLAQGDKILKNLSMAIWVFSSLTALIGLGILFISHLHRQALWVKQGAILFSMGADSQWQKNMLLNETRLLWALSFIMAGISTEAIRQAMNFKLTTINLPPTLPSVIMVTAALMAISWILTKAQVTFTQSGNLNNLLRA